MYSKSFASSLLIWAALSATTSAQWAEWRGPARDGAVAAALVPASWPDALKEGWAAEVGEGYSTPVAGGGRVFVHARRDPDEVVTAFDLATGKPLWTDTHTAPFTKNQYATAMAKGPNATPLATIEGEKQMVTMTDTSVVGVATATGVLLWSLPFPDEWNENIVTPVIAGNVIVVSGTRKGTYGLRVGRDAGAWRAVEAWHSPETAMYMSSPVLVDGVLYGFSSRRKGQFFALDPATGKTRWMTEGRQAVNAHIVSAGKSLVAQLDTGEMIVAPATGDGFEVEHRYATGKSATYTHPLFVPGGVLVRDQTHLRLWKF